MPNSNQFKKKKKNKNNTNSITHFEFILFGPGLPMFTSHLLQFCLEALESLSISCTHLIGFWQMNLTHNQKNGKNTQETIALKAIPINL